MQYAAQWAAARGMQLDASLTMRDEGLSAYHQQHIRSGALGLFMAAVAAGRIVPGSVLIVEGLDRLSRAEPLQAQTQLAQIVGAGITVVTASDGREYTREGLKANPMDLVYSLLVMIRAHEESETKSRRVTASIHRLCEQWVAGTYRGRIRQGTDPSWLRWTGSAWELIPDQVAAVEAALAMYRAGHGPVRLARALSQRQRETGGPTLDARRIYRLVRQRGLVGDKELEVGDVRYLLRDYYPALMTREDFDTLQTLADDRGRRRVRGELPHIITGIGITRCGYCGEAMAGQHLASKPRLPDGRIRDSYRRLLCGGRSIGIPCAVPGSCSVAPVERALMRYCSDQMHLDSLRSRSADATAEPRARLEAARASAQKLDAQIERLTSALADDADAPPLAVLRRLRESEQALAEHNSTIASAERELAHAARQSMTHDDAAQWAALAEAVDAQDYNARLTARQLVAQTFASIVVYPRGIFGQEPGTVVVSLQVKHGTFTRLLHLDAKTGEVQRIEDR